MFAYQPNELIDFELLKILAALIWRTRAPAHRADDVATEGAVAFHLRFAKPLVGRTLVRKILVQRSIAPNVGGLAAVKPGLHID